MGLGRVFGSIVIVSLMGAPVAALAQDQEPASADTPAVMGELFGCRAIEDEQARLACYDREVERVYQAQASRELVITDREQIKEARRGLFGLKLPKIRLFGDDDASDGDRVDEITATLSGATRLDNGRYVFTLEDGARWLETENVAGSRRFGAGDTIVIKRAALGSFKAKVNGKKAVRVRRLN